jgi:hypothetical protein
MWLAIDGFDPFRQTFLNGIDPQKTLACSSLSGNSSIRETGFLIAPF